MKCHFWVLKKHLLRKFLKFISCISCTINYYYYTVLPGFFKKKEEKKEQLLRPAKKLMNRCTFAKQMEHEDFTIYDIYCVDCTFY